MEYREFCTEYMDQVRAIYEEEQWSAYLNDDARLERAFAQSLYILGAFDQGRLVGFARCVGDGEHILVVQDLIVALLYRRQGIGTRLFRAVWDRYGEVRMFHVVTDLSDPVDNQFYRSFGMKKLEEGSMVSYFR